MYVVARTAKDNPEINGRTLYLTAIGMWTLNIKHALKFIEQDKAEKKLATYPEANVQFYRGDE